MERRTSSTAVEDLARRGAAGARIEEAVEELGSPSGCKEALMTTQETIVRWRSGRLSPHTGSLSLFIPSRLEYGIYPSVCRSRRLRYSV